MLLLSRDSAYGVLTKYIVAGITTKIRNIPIEVPLGPFDGLRRACVVNFDSLRTVAKEYLVEKVSKLSAQRTGEVKRAGYALEWEELMDAV